MPSELDRSARGGCESNRLLIGIAGCHLQQLTVTLQKFRLVVNHLDPVAKLDTQCRITARARHIECRSTDSAVRRLAGCGYDSVHHRTVLPRPFEGRGAIASGRVYFDPVELILQAAIARLRR
jgi:hypothetical protein